MPSTVVASMAMLFCMTVELDAHSPDNEQRCVSGCPVQDKGQPVLLQAKAATRLGTPPSEFFDEDAVQMPTSLERLPDMALHDVGSGSVPALSPEESSQGSNFASLLALQGRTASASLSGSLPDAREETGYPGEHGELFAKQRLAQKLSFSDRLQALAQLKAQTRRSAETSRSRTSDQTHSQAARQPAEITADEDEQMDDPDKEAPQQNPEEPVEEEPIANPAPNEEEAEVNEEENDPDVYHKKPTAKASEEEDEQTVGSASKGTTSSKASEEENAEPTVRPAPRKAKASEEERVDEEEQTVVAHGHFEENEPTRPAAQTPDKLGPQHGGHCTPKCTWSCDKPVCEEVCTPVCQPPKCETRCTSISTKGCSMECQKPHCATECRRAPCPAKDCPACQTRCGEPQCKLMCPNWQPCETVCEQPICDWKCQAPSTCREPQCSMVCESPKKCQTSRFTAALPELQEGQIAVETFLAPTVGVQAARENEDSQAPNMIDVRVKSRAAAHAQARRPRERMISMPVL
jgi:hypothetical protein